MASHVVEWKGGRRFTARTPDSREGRFDVPVDKGGDGTAPSPMETVLHALAACTAVDVVSILERMRCPAESLSVEIEAERAPEHPKVYTRIVLTWHVTGEVPRKNLERAIALSHETYCSVGAMLGKTAEIVNVQPE